MIQVKKLIQGNYVPIMDRHLDRHATNNCSPCIRDELTRCSIYIRKELHNKMMN